jgi:hypothetical protein
LTIAENINGSSIKKFARDAREIPKKTAGKTLFQLGKSAFEMAHIIQSTESKTYTLFAIRSDPTSISYGTRGDRAKVTHNRSRANLPFPKYSFMAIVKAASQNRFWNALYPSRTKGTASKEAPGS